MVLKKGRCKFTHSDKWGVLEQNGEIIRWKIKDDGKLYAEIKPDKKIPSIEDTIDILECHVDKE